MKLNFIFELRVPVACTLSFGKYNQIPTSCLPGDVVCFGIIKDDDQDFKSIYLKISDIKPMNE